MANLTFPNPRAYQLNGQSSLEYPMSISIVYEGSALADATDEYGLAEADTLIGGENFLGFANATVDNRAGTHQGQTIGVITEGVVKLSVTGVTASSTGAIVYAIDGNTFTLTSSGNSAIGKVVKIVSGTTVLVKFQGIGFRSI